jgi:hypothetical protein
VPAATRPRTHGETGPTLGWEQAARRSEQGPVDGRVPRPLPSPPEDRELIAQTDNLDLPLTTAVDVHRIAAAPRPLFRQRRVAAGSPAGSSGSLGIPANCKSLNARYPHGAGRLRAHDHTKSRRPCHEFQAPQQALRRQPRPRP